MKIAQYVETFSYVGMFNTMNFAYYIYYIFISPFMQHPVGAFSVITNHRMDLFEALLPARRSPDADGLMSRCYKGG